MSQDNLQIYAEKLGAMIRIPTISKTKKEDLTQFRLFNEGLERLFPLLHTNLEKTDLGEALLFRWKGTDSSKQPILFMGHQDVVPASDEGWIVPAYSGEVVDGNLYGRGAIDCKGHLFVIFQAIEELLQEGFVPPCDIYLECSVNEETGGDGAPGAVRYLKEKGVTLALVLDEGGAIVDKPIPGMDKPYALLGIMEKGVLDLKITAKGKGGHSSAPPRNTPTARLFAFANEIEKKRPFKKVLLPETKEMFHSMSKSFGFPLRFLLGNIWLFKPLLLALMPKISSFGEALLSTTCCFTMMQGSDAANVIPKEPYLVANLRPAAHQNCKASLAVIQKYAAKYDLEIEVLQEKEPSPISNIHSKEYAYLANCIKNQFPDIGIAPYVMMAGTDCRHFHALTDNAIRFSPIRMTMEQTNSTHAVNENVTVSALVEGVMFVKQFVKGWK